MRSKTSASAALREPASPHMGWAVADSDKTSDARQRRGSLDLRLLGPVELEIAGRRRSVGGPRAQAVLALLAVRLGEIVPADWLIEEVWSGRPPRSARVALQSYVSRLRKLGTDETEQMLPRHPRGYFLDPSAVRVDAAHFVKLSKQGRRQATADRWREALASLQSARALWHGAPFTGIDEVPALMAERRRLEELGIETRFNELEAELEILGPVDVIGSLRHLVDTHPWDERGWRLLMLAMYRAGRQTEALGVAAQARHLFAEEQGLDPSSELIELEYRILNHHPALNPAAAPPLKLRNRLSAAPAALYGRTRELGELQDQWERSRQDRRARLVLVSGEQGVGKSRLVTELAGQVEAAGGLVWVGRCVDEPQRAQQPWSDLLTDMAVSVLEDTSDLDNRQSHNAGMSAHRLFSAVTDQFWEVLQHGAMLLVIEDVHWASGAELRLLDHLLACCADLPLLVVATMRSPAPRISARARGAMGELSARVQPHDVRLDGLTTSDLRAMLADRGCHVTAAEAASIRERTGGVPLLAMESLRGSHGVIDARLAKVSDQAAAIADLLAIAGKSTSFALLRAVTGLDEETLTASLEELIATGLLRILPSKSIAVEFVHPLYREFIEKRISDLRRRLLSRRLLAASRAHRK